ncbi:RNA polymerase I enhancer binding protein [Pseudogymnoascus destructans]|uniref:RNA polymerase I enhancer binding protein n=2 Tax=Pseudogymnoascus destructans TaxID=655981 RepID=A0A177A4Z9_9PEZI|nr:RNA polymerase I enhancer binding protein [Pseudogymnoascus destructans]OAF57329.1 RNA polymerase I enhancer binding protein [Pseudogymnoascus destructans]
MGQESSQVQRIEEDSSSMDGNSSTRSGVGGDYPLPALPPSREAREETINSSAQRKRKMSNGISEDGAGDRSDSARRAHKKLKKMMKKKNKAGNGGNSEGKDTDLTSSVKQRKKKNRMSEGVARQCLGVPTSQSAPLRSAASVLLPRSDTVERVPESSQPTAVAPSSSTSAKKKKNKSKAKRNSMQAVAAAAGGDGGGSGTGPKAADAESLAKDNLPEPAPTSSWAAVNVPSSATKAGKSNDDVNIANGQSKQAEEATAGETESKYLEKQTDVNSAKPKSSQIHPIEEMDLDPTQSQNTPANPVEDAMDLAVAEPENATEPQNATAGPANDSGDSREILEVANKDVPQIGVYAAGEEPTSTTRRRKRRLPVDDDPMETPSKKSKKALKAKSPVTKSQKTKAAAKSPASSAAAPRTPTRAAAADGKPAPRMTDDDLAVIKNQLLKYREMNDIAELEQNRLIHGKANESRDLFNMVCEEFPNRDRWSLIKFCRRKFHNFTARGKWSAEDDEYLREAHRQMPNRWTQIGQRLNRHPEDCRDRWRNYLICGDNMITVYWDDYEEQKLRDAVAACVSHLQEMRQLGVIESNPDDDEVDDTELVDWQQVSEKMGRTRSRLQCRQKWRRMHEREDPDKFDTTPLKVGAPWREKLARKETQQMGLDDKLVILRSIKESRVGREGKINWKKVGDEKFQERFAVSATKMAYMKLKDTVPDANSHVLQEIVEILLEKLGNANGQDPTEKSFKDTTGIRKTRSKPTSAETINPEDDEESDDDAGNQIRQELPKLTNTTRSPKKLSDRMARRSESVDSVGNAVPSGGPEVPESDYEEPAAPKTNGAQKSAKANSNSNSNSDSDSDNSDLDGEIPARRVSILL